MESIRAGHRPKEKDLFPWSKLVQGFLQSVADVLTDLFPALPPPLFSSFQQVHDFELSHGSVLLRGRRFNSWNQLSSTLICVAA